MLYADVSEHSVPYSQAGRYEEYLPACEDGIVCSETVAYKVQTPENYPEQSIQVKGP